MCNLCTVKLILKFEKFRSNFLTVEQVCREQMYSYILTPFLPVYLGTVKAAAVDVCEEHGVHQCGLKSPRNIYILSKKKSLVIFPSSAGMSQTKLSLAETN